VLCLAAPKTLLTEIETALATCSLYADVIAPDFMLRFSETGAREVEAPGMVLMQDLDGTTVLVWDAEGKVVHSAPVALVPDGEAQRRMAARVFRYARIVGHEGGAVAVYADGEELEVMLRASLPFGGELTLLSWPVGAGGLGGLL
jgi:hypothetical protein